ncbi:hypothetical protein BGZ51_006827 [Haplosporangium sp. Z 767]|nr:hypothetical protein BGZ51_006827 [Haplosporangium sp. Z 767]
MFQASSQDQEKPTTSVPGWETDSDVPDECRSFMLPMGGTLGDLINATPEESISRVITDARLFETWHHGRTVLIGDACHRMLPNTAHQGAVNAIHDAVTLANLIHDLPSASAENLVVLFKEFHALRYPLTKTQMQMDQKANKMLRGQSWTEALMRKLLVRYMSKIYRHFGDTKILADRPQATFMPLIESRGDITALPQMAPKVFGDDRQSKH